MTTRLARAFDDRARYRPASVSPQDRSRFRELANGKPDLSGVWQSGGVSLYGEPGLSKIKLPLRR